MAREPLMERARELAERGRYTVAPNPLVGAVVVHNEKVVGEGWHARAGGDHAEIVALKESGEAARGATMYVTLEPCNHHGRTPPCTDAVLRAGISRVMVGRLDPDPRMRGRSVGVLREAGVEVVVLDDPAFERQNEQFSWRMGTGRPFVHLKLATTLDGRIAAANGDSRWVTGEAARFRAHLLRAEAGAVLVGASTVRADDPLLVPRDLPEDPPPVTRVVLDPCLSAIPGSRLVATAREAPVLVFADESCVDGRERGLVEAGAEVVAAPRSGEDSGESSGGGLDLPFVLDELGRRGVRGLLVEGGGETAGRLIREGLVNKLTLFYAPKLLGSEGIPSIGALRIARMAEASRFSVSGVERVGEDVAMTLYPSKGEEEHVHRTG